MTNRFRTDLARVGGACAVGLAAGLVLAGLRQPSFSPLLASVIALSVAVLGSAALILSRALRRATEEWERTFDSVPDLIAILDNQHRLVRVNKAMADRLGRAPAECIGLPCYRSLHGADKPPAVCPHRLTLADGRQHVAEVHEDSLGGDFLVSTTPLHDGAGRLIGTVHVARDITERKMMETREREALALATASQTAVDILETMGEGVLLTDTRGRILSVNPALERMSGLRERDVVGRRLDMFIPRLIARAERKAVFDLLRRAFRGEPGTAGQPLTLMGPSGRLPVLCGVSFIRGSDGKPTSLVVTLRDISEIEAVQRTLAESERKYRELIENANSIILRITPDHTITFFNEYAESFFGYRKEEILGRGVLGTIVPETDSAGHDLRKMMRELSLHPEIHRINENENVCRDGRRVWVHWANRAIRDEQGTVREILCVGTDITERRRMETENLRYQQRLRELAEQLANSEEQERRELSRAIHDSVVQNLSLASIRMGSFLNRLTDPSSAPEAKDLRTTRDLVNEAIAECRTVMSELAPPLLYELGLVPALADLAERLQDRHGVRIRVEPEQSSAPLDTALRGLLFQSARELILNALKHADPRSILVTVASRKGNLLITVEDDGKGFDPARAEQPASHGGFGLFSIRERIEGLGGRLDVRSSPGSGTKAVISVPAAEHPGPVRGSETEPPAQ